MANASSSGLFRASLIQTEVVRVVLAAIPSYGWENQAFGISSWIHVLGHQGTWRQLKISECNDLLRVVFSEHGFALAAQSSADTVSWDRECWLFLSTPLPCFSGIASCSAALSYWPFSLLKCKKSFSLLLHFS